MAPDDMSNSGVMKECLLDFASSDTKVLNYKIERTQCNQGGLDAQDPSIQKDNTIHCYREQIEALVHQLKVNEELHAKALKEHQAILAKKERLIQEKKKDIESMKESHEKILESLTQSQQRALSACQMQHDMETAKLKWQLDRQEKEAKGTAVEQLLNDFEQEQHTLRAYDTDVSSTALAPSPPDRKPITNKNTPYIRPLYIPTFAISWPAPPPLSSLKKSTLGSCKEN